MKSRKRMAVVVLFLTAGGFLYWWEGAGPSENHLIFVLTGVEVPNSGQMLRHESITRLECRVLDEAGEQVAHIHHRRPGAVSNMSTLRLPEANYRLHVTLTFKVAGNESRRVQFLRERFLGGGNISVHL
jgi:hypothetical protein